MIDRDRLIKAWKVFRDSNPYEICDGREFIAIKEPEYRMGQMIEDTIALLDDCDTQLQYRDDHIAMYQAEINRLETLLKEQEAVEPKTEPSAKGYWYTCGACGWWLFEVRDTVHFDDRKRIRFCASCGRRVKWDA